MIKDDLMISTGQRTIHISAGKVTPILSYSHETAFTDVPGKAGEYTYLC